MHIGLKVMITGFLSVMAGVVSMAGVEPALIIGGFVMFLAGLIWLIGTQ